MDDTLPCGGLCEGQTEPQANHDDRCWRCETQPGGKAAGPAALDHSDGDPRLAGGGAGEELAKRNQIGKTTFVDPAAAVYELCPKVAKMRDRATKRGCAKHEECEEYFEDAGTVVGLRGAGNDYALRYGIFFDYKGHERCRDTAILHRDMNGTGPIMIPNMDFRFVMKPFCSSV